MLRQIIFTPILFLFVVIAYPQSTKRTVAVTIDDLPVVSTRRDLKNRIDITRKLLSHIRKSKIPAIGFVNENKLYDAGKRDEKQVDLLRMWVDAGLELGNHTYSHRSLNKARLEPGSKYSDEAYSQWNSDDITLYEYVSDVLKGEAITRELLRRKKKTLRYFRHPFLQTGRSLEVKTQFEAFLAKHGYTIAPVSIDNADYIFSAAYDRAFDKGDEKLMRQIGDAYVPYVESKTAYWERQSIKLFGREISQTLLIHANFINSDYLDDLAAMFKRRGYSFVTLEQALRDEAYRLPDTYIGPAGISWLHRWAREKGREYVVTDEPKVPEFVLKASGFASE